MPPVSPVTSSSSSAGFADGLGLRSIGFDRESGGLLERLQLRPELAVFEPLIRDAAGRWAALKHDGIARIRGIERENARLIVTSEPPAGERLAELLDARHSDDYAPPGVDAALGFLVDILPALAVIHRGGLAHGTLAPGRVVISPQGRVVLVEGLFAAAVEQAGFGRRALASVFGVLLPGNARGARLDAAADLSQAALCAIALALGRRIGPLDEPNLLGRLLVEVNEIAQIRAGGRFADDLRLFLGLLLSLERGGAPSAEAAAREARRLSRVIGDEAAVTALANLVKFHSPADIPAAVSAPPAPEAQYVEVEINFDDDLEFTASSRDMALGGDTDLEAALEHWETTSAGEDWTAGRAGEHHEEPAYRLDYAFDPPVPPALSALTRDGQSDVAQPFAELPDVHDDPPAAPVIFEPVADSVSVTPAQPPLVAEPLVEVEEPGIGLRAEPEPALVAGTPPWSALEPEPEPEPEPELTPSLRLRPDSVAPADPAPLADAVAIAEPPPLPDVADWLRVPGDEQPAAIASTFADSFRAEEPLAAAMAETQAVEAAPEWTPPAAQIPLPTEPPTMAPPAPAVQLVPPPPAPTPLVTAPVAPYVAPQFQPPPAAIPQPQFALPPQPAPQLGHPFLPANNQPAGIGIRMEPLAGMSQAGLPTRLRAERPASYQPRRIRGVEPQADTDGAAHYPPLKAARAGGEHRWKIVAAALVMLIAGFASWPYLPGRAAEATNAPGGVDEAPLEIPPESKGTLIVDSQPAGAVVSIDGNEVGKTPLKLDTVPPGPHLVTIKTPTTSVQRTVQVLAARTVTIDVPVYSGWVAVFAPIRLEISERGKSLGTSDNQRIMLPPGRHVLTFSNRQFEYSTTETIEILAGEERVLNLQPRGVVNINASPWAEVWVDGTRAGETPLANLQVPLGTREFVFRHPLYGSRRIVTTITTKVAALSVDFTKPVGRP